MREILDGKKICKVCGKPIEVIIKTDTEKITKPCMCDCKRNQLVQERLEEERRDLERRKDRCFLGSERLKEATFETSESIKEHTLARSYAESFEAMQRKGKGLLFYGRVGSGKSHTAACIANRVLEQGKKVLMVNIPELVRLTQKESAEKFDTIGNLRKYDLIILDDFGVERKTEYMQEKVFAIVDGCYRAKRSMIVTTNLTGEDLNNPPTVKEARIYDRILEMCLPVEFKGASRRRAKMKAEYTEMREFLEAEHEKD